MNVLTELAREQNLDVAVIGLSPQERLWDEIESVLIECAYRDRFKFNKQGVCDLRQDVPLILAKAKGTNAIREKKRILNQSFTGLLSGSDTAIELALTEKCRLFQVIDTKFGRTTGELMYSKASPENKTSFARLYTKYPQMAAKVATNVGLRIGEIIYVESDAEVLAAADLESVAFDLVESGSSKRENNLMGIKTKNSVSEDLTNFSLRGFMFNDFDAYPTQIADTTLDFWNRYAGVLEARSKTAIAFNVSKEALEKVNNYLGSKGIESQTVGENMDGTYEVKFWYNYNRFMNSIKQELSSLDGISSLGVAQNLKMLGLDVRPGIQQIM